MGQINSYSVVDVETTGFSPKHHHRIIEIAIVRVDSSGKLENEYETLINPNRDVGPTHVHGLRASDLRDAPTFEQAAGDILVFLKESTFVAHNARFDWSFVEAEFSRLGVSVQGIPLLCTMKLAEILDPTIPSRKLSAICRHLSIPLNGHHCALADAQATAEVLTRFLRERSGDTPRLLLEHFGSKSENADGWPNICRTGKTLTRNESQRTTRDPVTRFLAALVEKLPSYKDCTPGVNSYLACLDEALADRVLTAEELMELGSLAIDLGLSNNQIQVAHTRYLNDLIKLALRDSVISDHEAEDISRVANILGVCSPEIVNLGRLVQKRQLENSGRAAKHRVDPEFVAGKTICFTGTFECDVVGHRSGREAAELLATIRGMNLKTSVIKKLNYLVAADVESMSTKARKAREYGVRILSESEFWNLMGFEVRS